MDELQQAVKEGWIGGLEAKRAIHKLVVNAKAVVQIDADVDENIDVDENENDLSMAADGHCTCKADNAGSARNTTMVTRQGDHDGDQNGDHGGNPKKDENERKESNKENKEKEEKGVVEEGEEKNPKKVLFFCILLFLLIMRELQERIAPRHSPRMPSHPLRSKKFGCTTTSYRPTAARPRSSTTAIQPTVGRTRRGAS